MLLLSISFLSVIATLVFTYQIIFRILVQRHRRKLELENRCEEPPNLCQFDSYLGLDTLIESHAAVKKGDFLDLNRLRFEKIGRTYRFRQLRKNVINTIEPENIRAILSSRFSDYSVASERVVSWDSLLGPGILTSDGDEWNKARRMLRPMFSQPFLEDISMFEPHFAYFKSQVSCTALPLNLQELFRQTATSISSDFLFGRNPSEPDSEEAREMRDFSTAFSQAQKMVGVFSALGRIAPLAILTSTKYHKHSQTVHDYVDRLLSRQRNSVPTEPLQTKPTTPSPPTSHLTSHRPPSSTVRSPTSSLRAATPSPTPSATSGPSSPTAQTSTPTFATRSSPPSARNPPENPIP